MASSKWKSPGSKRGVSEPIEKIRPTIKVPPLKNQQDAVVKSDFRTLHSKALRPRAEKSGVGRETAGRGGPDGRSVVNCLWLCCMSAGSSAEDIQADGKNNHDSQAE